jgi:hypothetical protein
MTSLRLGDILFVGDALYTPHWRTHTTACLMMINSPQDTNSMFVFGRNFTLLWTTLPSEDSVRKKVTNMIFQEKLIFKVLDNVFYVKRTL